MKPLLIPTLCTLVLTLGCATTLKPQVFANTAPPFDPITFWAGHTASWGVIENGGGEPTGIVTTTTEGTAEGRDGLHMIQHLIASGKETVRDWHIRRVDSDHFEATANDMVGLAKGESNGRTFNWTWTWATHPGNPLLDVTMQQWMYLSDNGVLMNRTVISKLGIRLGEVSEQFVRHE